MSLRARYNGKKARDRCKRAENALNEKKRKEKRQEEEGERGEEERNRGNGNGALRRGTINRNGLW